MYPEVSYPSRLLHPYIYMYLHQTIQSSNFRRHISLESIPRNALQWHVEVAHTCINPTVKYSKNSKFKTVFVICRSSNSDANIFTRVEVASQLCSNNIYAAYNVYLKVQKAESY
jgi:hypothetical protein